MYTLSGIRELSATELELIILSRLDVAAIANQRQHCPLAARIILTTLKMLQDSNVFKEKRETTVTKRWGFIIWSSKAGGPH